ncbi:MAG: DUF11 domain-containing protein, partial [Demequinaceae bacterium]|nr:DUF11 domain-containing protein [Demequinaceae bacterium]
TPPSGPDVTDTDAVTLTVVTGPGITLTKTTSDTLVTGGTITFTLEAENTGNVTLTGVQISEGLAGASVVGTCDPVTLAPSATMSCTFEYTATQADVDAGSLTNSASVVGTPPTGPDVTDTDAVTLTAATGPGITLTKTTSDTLAAGNAITYTLEAENTGNVTLTGVQISEGLAGASVVGTCGPVTLAPAATVSCDFEYVATQADIDAGSLTNSASVVGTPPVGPDVMDTDVVTLTATAAPSISLAKTTSDALALGATITYTLEAENTGNVTLTGVQISEALAGATVVGSCSPATLAPSATTTCVFEYTATQADVDAGSLTNSASVVGTPPSGPNVTDTDAVTLTATQNPAISLSKSSGDPLVAGGTITYTLEAENTGYVTLTGVQISEGLAGATVVGTCDPVTLIPGETVSCTVEYVATQADIDAGSLTNSASVIGTPPTGPDVTDTDAVTLTVTAAPSISLTKTTSDSLVAGGTITYTIEAENTGNVTLTGVQISEALAGAFVVGTCDPVTLVPAETTTCTFEYTATQTDVDAGSLTNSASVVGTTPSGPDVTDTDTVTLTATVSPSISLTKTTSDSLALGATITYTLEAENTGNVTLTGVQISEALAGATVVGSCDPATLAPSATTTCVFEYVVLQSDIDAGSLVNSASVVGTPPTGPDVTDTDAVTLTTGGVADIELTKTTGASNVNVGDVVTYTLTAENTGGVTLTDVTMAESLPGASFVGTCDPVTLAPAATTTCTVEYTATQADIDAGSIVNAASVTGTPPTGPDVTDTDTVTVATLDDPDIGVVVTVDPTTYNAVGDVLTFTVVTTNTGNVTLFNTQLASTLAGADTSACDAVNVTLAPGESVTCLVTYSIVLADLNVPGKTLSVVASGQSVMSVSVVASGAVGAGPHGFLAGTGDDVAAQALVAAVLVAAGLLLIFLSRRRREEQA